MDDLFIRGALMIAGSGSPGREADVVAPGFIDIRTLSEFFLPLNARAESKIRLGG